MFRTKKDVDMHCRDVFSKCKNEKEKNLRSLSVAQQYFNVNDYESAKRYVIQYLAVNDNSPVAHKLLAQCHEYFGEKQKAFAEYKYSLQLDPKQSELLLKVCELLSDSSVSVDKNQVKYWHEKAEHQFPYHPTVFKLKQKACMPHCNDNLESVETVLLEQVKSKFHDVSSHTHLLKFYIENGRVKDAYDKAFHHEPNFQPDALWYECGTKICKLYKTQFPLSLNEEYYANYMLVLDRLLALSIQDVKIYRKSIPECVALLASFDEILSTATALLNKSERFLTVISHMCGQLCFHIALLVYRKAKWEDNNWPEITQLSAPLLLLSTADSFKIRDTKDGALSSILKPCFQHNVYRISQAGFVLLSLVKDSQKKFIEKIFHFAGTNYWRERIFEKIYSTSDYKNFKKTSFFMNYNEFSDLPSELPKSTLDDVRQYVLVTEIVQPASLHHLVWLGVQYLSLSKKESIVDSYLPPKFAIKSINTLQFSPNLNSSGYAESLSAIDVEAYLYACVFSAKSSLTHQTSVNNPQSTYILPADVSKLLCSPAQEEWWEYMCMMTNESIPDEKFSRSRSILQRGIESIRLLGNCTLPLQLLILLGRTFANKATIESDSDRASALESRALLYWKAALPSLKHILRNECYSIPSKPLFEYYEKLISKADAAKLYAEGRRFEGMLLVKEKNYSESMFMNESYEEIENVSVESLNTKANVFDEKLLQTINEQNIKIMDKLETLYNKHELLSSNQLQLFTIVSMLSKKLEDVLIMPNDGYLDSLSATLPFPSPQNPVSVAPSVSSTFSMPSSTNFTPSFTGNGKPSTTNFMPSFTGSGLYPIQPNLQTGFKYPFTQSIPLMSENAVVFPPYVPMSAPVPPIQLHIPFFNNPLPDTPDTKESYTMINRSIASTGVFNTSAPFASTPNKSPLSPLGASKHTSLNEAFERGHNNMLRDMLNNSVSKERPQFSADEDVNSEFARGRLSGAIDFVQKCRTFEDNTSTKTASRIESKHSLSTHSFQIPNVTPVVQSPSVQVPEDEEEEEDEHVAEHDPIPDFKPIIPLPDEVEVKTGEEEEEVLFEERAKLFRFAEKQWKERGTGPLKILKNPESGRVRILMRRDLTHKVCANHFLSEEMNLTPTTSSDRAWVYCAADFADEKINIEKFSLKFKTVELANKFFNVFNEYKKHSSNTLITPISKKASVEVVENQNSSSFGLPISTPVSKKGSPTIQSTSAEKTTRKVVLAPPVVNVEEKRDDKTLFGGFTFSSKPIISNVPEKKEVTNVEEKKKTPFSSFAGFNLNSLSQTYGDSKLFHSTVTSTVSSKMVDDSSPFASVKNTIDFSTLSKNADPSAFVKSKDFKGFAGAGSLVFGGASVDSKQSTSSYVEAILKNVNSKTETKDISKSPNVQNDSCASNDDDFVPTAEFTPAIPMPDLVEIKTGEEGLQVLYEEQCKLFRFDQDEWKERGVGKMKILRDDKDGSVRLLMRRDQVYKVCCNQRLTKDFELKPMKTTEKAWTWYGQDFSEGELKNELFCIRFKKVEQAEEFKKAFDEAKLNIDTTKPGTKITSETLPALSEIFKRDQNAWECKVCYVVNKTELNECAACSTPKDGSTPSNKPLSTSPVLSSNTSIFGGSGTASGSSFGFSSTVSTSVADKFSFGILPTPASTTENVFSFGSYGTVTSKLNPVSTSQNSSSIFNKPVFSFGSAVSQKQESGGLIFGNPNFSFGTSPSSENTTSADNIGGESVMNLKKSDFSIFSDAGKAFSPKDTPSAFSTFTFKLDDKKPGFVVSDDVEFVSEMTVSDEEKKLAESLMLPSNFYNYKYSESCRGCIGCESDHNSPDIADKNQITEISSTKPNNKEENAVNLSTGAAFTREGTGFAFVGAGENLQGSNKSTFNFSSVFSQSGGGQTGDSSIQKSAADGNGKNTGFMSKPTFNFLPSFVHNDSQIDADSSQVGREDGSEDEKDASVVSNDHDPHFEPVVPLPQIVETKTGEEDEIVEFCERSKLFRYDEEKKEWKERGVGELKILYHPVHKSYRFLLRRDQVHKVVLNQRITTSLALQPMSASANSLCWFGMNLPEECNEPVVEKLAARFKNDEIKQRFQEVVDNCIAQLNINSVIADDQVDNYGDDVAEESEEYGENDYYVNEEGIKDAMEELGDNAELMFESPVTFEVSQNDKCVSYEANLRLVKYSEEEDDESKSYFTISTSGVPTLYTACVEKDIVPILENDCIAFADEDESEPNAQINLRFPNEELANHFYNLYEELKT